MEPDENMESDVSPRYVASNLELFILYITCTCVWQTYSHTVFVIFPSRHVAQVSPSLPFTEPSQSLSPPPGPSGFSLLSPPQPGITPNQPQISTSNQYQLTATINRLHLAAANQRQTATALSSLAQNPSVAQTGNISTSAQTQASARTIQPALTNRDDGRAQITGPTASLAAAARRDDTPTAVGSSRAAGGGSTSSNIFQIPLSQDILAGSNDLSLGLGESQLVGTF